MNVTVLADQQELAYIGMRLDDDDDDTRYKM